jgi:glycosyltransferase involved in cell wall biosynthesis
VNNGSTDSTKEIFKLDDTEGIVKMNLPENAGYGGGIKAGIKLAKGEYIGWMHADLQYSLMDSFEFLNHIGRNKKYIKGRRRGREEEDEKEKYENEANDEDEEKREDEEEEEH